MTVNSCVKWCLRGGAVLAALVAVSGCANQNQVKATPDEQRRTEIEAQISDSLSLAVNAQRELAMTRDADVQQRAVSRTRLLTDRVSYDFYGDVEQIVGDIASKYGYELKVYGQRPPEHVNVNVYVNKMPVLEVLRYVGQTAGDWLDLRVSAGVIELTYKKPSHA
ncbi:hypothetical protein FAZ69_08225 [Trinickia terrae]|uniref:DotD/TraH family lipoprotein n=1 Tax=Trinickia terrae TaxID=2571161 RepID=A0A4U1I9N3_9BURK|nr:DotD/TraH family lipoprotein [Trinickia terrae]TKC90127.1 hypothetical protein FAZ69_08225 [Trinickia terrae]